MVASFWYSLMILDDDDDDDDDEEDDDEVEDNDKDDDNNDNSWGVDLVLGVLWSSRNRLSSFNRESLDLGGQWFKLKGI